MQCGFSIVRPGEVTENWDEVQISEADGRAT
jgi:hypothetical protein